MRKLYSIIVSLLLSFASSISFAAETSPPDQKCITLSNDSWNYIISLLDENDLPHLGRTSKPLRLLVLAVAGPGPDSHDIELYPNNAAKHYQRFRLYAALFNEPFELTSLDLKGSVEQIIQNAFLSGKSPFVTSSLKISNIPYLTENLNPILDKLSSPSLKKVVLNSQQYGKLNSDITRRLVPSPNLQEIIVTGLEMSSASLCAIAPCTSLQVLRIDELVCDDKMSFPNHLTTLSVEGCHLTTDLLKGIGNLDHLTTLRIEAKNRRSDDIVLLDISLLLNKIITDDMKELYVDGFFSADQVALEKIGSSKVEYVNFHQYLDLMMNAKTIRLTMGSTPAGQHAGFFALFPVDELAGALTMARALLAQNRQVLMLIQDESITVSDYENRGMATLTIQTFVGNEHLNAVLEQVNDEEKLALQLGITGKLNSDNFPFKIMKKNWQWINFDGDFSLEKDALSCFKFNAPHTKVNLSISGPTRSILTLKKLPRDQIIELPSAASARLYTHDKQAPVSAAAVLEVASMVKITQISIVGGHSLTHDDIRRLVNEFGFHTIYAGRNVIRLEGREAIMDYLENTAELPETLNLIRY